LTGSVPPSGILKTPPPAPVAVPPSGVLATVEHSHVPTLPFKTAQKLQTTKKTIPDAAAGTVDVSRRYIYRWLL
jgi:hypothetical protein